MWRFWCILWLGLSGLTAFAAVDPGQLSSEEFLRLMRRAQGAQQSYAGLDGEVRHRRSGQSTVTAPLYLGIWLTPERTMAQLIIDNREGYIIGQSYDSGADGSSVIPMGEYAHPVIGDYGLRPSDLTLAFIYWPLERELARESYKLQECRVLLLCAPTGEDWVKVYFSVANLFPMKAEWFKQSADVDSGKPYRTLEVASIRREGDLAVPSELNLFGPGWRTVVDFDEFVVGRGTPGEPPPVIRELPGQ